MLVRLAPAGRLNEGKHVPRRWLSAAPRLQSSIEVSSGLDAEGRAHQCAATPSGGSFRSSHEIFGAMKTGDYGSLGAPHASYTYCTSTRPSCMPMGNLGKRPQMVNRDFAT